MLSVRILIHDAIAMLKDVTIFTTVDVTFVEAILDEAHCP